MQKIIKIILTILLIFISNNLVDAWYKLENWSKKIVEKYKINKYNLGKQISRKEFVEILYAWYFDYKKDRWVKIDYSKFKKIDNKKYFTDINLDSSFWKKLNYFADKKAFAKNTKFNPKWKISQKDFFTIMRRLKIMYTLQQCKNLRICEKELDTKFSFSKWTYLKYISKILDKKLRKYYSSADDYIKAWYKSKLNPNNYFPLKWQTLNWCYPFSIRNITKYKYWIWMRIPAMEKYMKKPWKKLWNYWLMNNFDKLAHIKRKNFYRIDTLINSLQAWEPLAVTYYLKYYSWKDKTYHKVLHIVSAYSFDSKWVWISETVSSKRLRIPWNEIFNKYGNTRNNRIFRYEYHPKNTWTKKEIELEKKYNFLVGEY